jgi:hypothetical protein
MAGSTESNDVLHEQPIRPAYVVLLLGAPWVLVIMGVGLILAGVGVFGNRPTAVSVSALGFGAVMAIAGCLLSRISGPVEVSATGVKGNLEAMPREALILARSAAEKATPPDEPDRTLKIDSAAFNAVSEWATALPARSDWQILANRSINLDETLRLARRVIRLPAFQVATQQRQDENTMNEWMNGYLIASLSRLAVGIQKELAALTEAAEGAVTFLISSGGPGLRDILGVEDRFEFTEYDPVKITPNQTTGAPVLYTIEPIAELGIPTLYLGIHVVRMRREFWVLRVPVLPGAPLLLPDSFIDRYYRRVGPLPIGRQTPFDTTVELCRETMELFLDMAHRYLTAMNEGTDPIDASIWSAESPPKAMTDDREST